MEAEYDTIALVRAIAEDVMNWDKEDVIHLYNMLCEIQELLHRTCYELSDFVDMNRMPSMPHPMHGYTHIIWAVDRRGMVLAGKYADKAIPIHQIALSKKHRRAERIVANIQCWDTKDITDLHDMFASLRKTIKVGNLTISEIVDPDLIQSAGTLPESVPEYRIWAVDQQGRVLAGEHADEIKSMDDIIKEGVLVEARWMANCIESWNMMDVGVLRSMLLELKDILDDEAIAASNYQITDFVDMSSLPTVEIPADLPSEKLWAIDTAGYALVGDNADQIVSVADWCAMHRPAG